MVFSAGFARLTLVPLDATHQALASTADCATLEALGTPAGTAAADFVRRRIGAYAEGRSVSASDAAPVHDALCTAYLVAPEVITTRHLHVAVETKGELTVGRTVIDTRSQANQPPNSHVAFGADAALFVRLLVETFG